MDNFKEYTYYYDLFYQDKDYQKEVDFIGKKLAEYGHTSGQLLDVGCGTGKHASLLSQKGYKVTGIDLSQGMIDQASKNYGSNQIEFLLADGRDCDLGKSYEVVTSLFHVLSYQISNEDLQGYFNSIASHLDQGGLFMADFWYGHGEVSQGQIPTLKLHDGETEWVRRFSTSEHLIEENRVNVHYLLVVEDKAQDVFKEFEETHSMRYSFLPELRQMLEMAGLELPTIGDWLTDQPVKVGTWNAHLIARKS